MSLRTLFLSRLLGVYFIICALAMTLRKQEIIAGLAGFLQNPLATLFTGIFALMAGLAIVLAHNLWSGGVLPVIVTLMGWLVMIKALLLLFLPPQMQAGFFMQTLHFGQLFYLYMAVCFVLGAYLAYAGFRLRLASRAASA